MAKAHLPSCVPLWNALLCLVGNGGTNRPALRRSMAEKSNRPWLEPPTDGYIDVAKPTTH